MANEIQKKMTSLIELETSLKKALGTDEVDVLEELFSKTLSVDIDPVLMAEFFRYKKTILEISKELEYPAINVYANYDFTKTTFPIIKIHDGFSIDGMKIPFVKGITVKSPSNNISEVTFTVIGQIEGIDLLDESL